jgi:hypothetical protein
MSEPFTQRLHFSGFVHYPWVIGGAVAVFIVGLSYLRFLLHLPFKIRSLFIVAGALYVGGALGVESVCANLDYLYGFKNLRYSLVAGIEELCEMSGVVIFIYALMRYAASTGDVVAVSFEDQSAVALGNASWPIHGKQSFSGSVGRQNL